MHEVAGLRLRRLERSDIDALYVVKNDPEVTSMLGGFSVGYSKTELEGWVDFHRAAKDEAFFVIADTKDRAIGHVALYKINHRIRSAEFAILIGDRSTWGKGLGRACTRFAVEYGFDQLNLRRIQLEVLATNERAIRLYRSVGFVEEGRLRQAQWQQGEYVDVLLMGLLIEEYRRDAA
jgi:[ribosomal protein S5]-alanine N-acetyltransferase